VRRERDDHPGSTVTVVLGDRVHNRLIADAFAHRHSLAIKARLLFEPWVAVTDLNVLRRSRRTALAPMSINHVEQVVLIADLTRPIREALTYAQGWAPVMPSRRHRCVPGGWAQWADAVPIRPGDRRQRTGGSFRPRRYLRAAAAALPGTMICAILPEFVVPACSPASPDQTGLAIKGARPGTGHHRDQRSFHLQRRRTGPRRSTTLGGERSARFTSSAVPAVAWPGSRGRLRVFLGRSRCQQDLRHARRGTPARPEAGCCHRVGRAGRPLARISDLEIIPRRGVAYRERLFEEMDLGPFSPAAPGGPG
jgi:hypothetical protein